MKKKISVIIKEPWMKPRHTYISNTLENLQRTVEGYIEHVDLGHDGLHLIVNEEGVINNLWCQLISSGKKTIEVRKTRPKLDLPFKCYIYQTQPKKSLVGVLRDGDELYGEIYRGKTAFIKTYKGVSAGSRTFGTWGKVVGEFVCDAILPISVKYSDPNNRIAQKEFPYTCLTDKQIMDYLGNGREGYGWHISNLKIYDQPKKVTEFLKPCRDPYRFCDGCKHGIVKYPAWVETREDLDGVCYDTECLNTLHRPPQSWCYVEELK